MTCGLNVRSVAAPAGGPASGAGRSCWPPAPRPHGPRPRSGTPPARLAPHSSPGRGLRLLCVCIRNDRYLVGNPNVHPIDTVPAGVGTRFADFDAIKRYVRDELRPSTYWQVRVVDCGGSLPHRTTRRRPDCSCVPPRASPTRCSLRWLRGFSGSTATSPGQGVLRHRRQRRGRAGARPPQRVPVRRHQHGRRAVSPGPRSVAARYSEVEMLPSHDVTATAKPRDGALQAVAPAVARVSQSCSRCIRWPTRRQRTGRHWLRFSWSPTPTAGPWRVWPGRRR